MPSASGGEPRPIREQSMGED
nr:unnamed protein product [Callosobruchus analis]